MVRCSEPKETEMSDQQPIANVEPRSAKRTGAPAKLSKSARLEAMLRRPKGATQKQLETGLGWQPHTVRAAISQLRKAGAAVTLDRSVRTPIYRIVSVS